MTNTGRAQFRYILRNDFYNFMVSCFYELHPHATFLPNWHLEIIADKLAACQRGEIKRLVINLPPRQLKSVFSSVALPAYLLGHDPAKQIICVSYGQDLSDKMAIDTRNVMISPRYKQLFSTRLVSDRCSVNELVTTKRGYRLATSVGGVLTGRGADFIIIDDPLKPDEAHSDSGRNAVNAWYDNTLISRLNNKTDGCIIIIMQRLHEDDLVGHVMGLEDWDVVSFPAIAAANEEYEIDTAFGRTNFIGKEGEALHHEREPLLALENLRHTMGEYNFSAQYQQLPIPPGGAIIQNKWLMYYGLEDKPLFDKIVQSWDTAIKAHELADYSVCVTFGIKGKHFYVLDVFRQRLEYPDLKKAVLAQRQKHNATQILIEDKASGSQLIPDLKREGVTGVIAYDTANNEKIMRVHAQTAKFEEGLVFLPHQAHWLQDFIRELTGFPNGKFDDQVDATIQAIEYFSNKKIGWFTT